MLSPKTSAKPPSLLKLVVLDDHILVSVVDVGTVGVLRAVCIHQPVVLNENALTLESMCRSRVSTFVRLHLNLCDYKRNVLLASTSVGTKPDPGV